MVRAVATIETWFPANLDEDKPKDSTKARVRLVVTLFGTNMGEIKITENPFLIILGDYDLGSLTIESIIADDVKKHLTDHGVLFDPQDTVLVR